MWRIEIIDERFNMFLPGPIKKIAYTDIVIVRSVIASDSKVHNIF